MMRRLYREYFKRFQGDANFNGHCLKHVHMMFHVRLASRTITN